MGRLSVRGSALAAVALIAAACAPIPAPEPGLDVEAGLPSGAGGRPVVARLSGDLAGQAEALSRAGADLLKGRNGRISDEERILLFKSEEFAAAARLFARLAEENSDFFGADGLRTNVYDSFLYLSASFRQLDQTMERGRRQPEELSRCRRLIGRLEREFAAWPEGDGPAALEDKYVKAHDATVYLIEREGAGGFVRRPFKSLESLFRFNYDRKRGKNPWDYFVEVKAETLNRMRRGRMIDLTFEGQMVMEQNARKGASVYLIRQGRKCGLSRIELVSRYGGWGKVFEVPRDILDAYPDGEPLR